MFKVVFYSLDSGVGRIYHSLVEYTELNIQLVMALQPQCQCSCPTMSSPKGFPVTSRTYSTVLAAQTPDTPKAEVLPSAVGHLRPIKPSRPPNKARLRPSPFGSPEDCS